MTRPFPRNAFRHRPSALSLAVALACSGPALAATSPADGASPEAAAPARIRPLAGVRLTGTVANNDHYVTNPDGTIAVGNLGDRYEAFAGAEFPVDVNGLSIRLTGGIHVNDSLSGGGGHERFTRIPIEATLWYPLNGKLRIGGGIRYAMHPRFSGAGRNTSDNLNATPALVAGVGYEIVPHLLLEGRYVYERFEDYGGSDMDASHWGVGITAIY